MAEQFIRHVDAAGIVRVGVRSTDTPQSVHPVAAASVAALLELPLEELRRVAESALLGAAEPVGRLLPPVDGLTEVWASGVTYQRSSDARQEESQVSDVYARVYLAERPELFFKAAAWRVCGDGEPLGIRHDSAVDVPEPELAVVCNAAGAVVGLTVCNDMSSRSIEGENPLYLPQAKVYSGSCGLGPGIVAIWTVPDVGSLDISVTVQRGGEVVWGGTTSTAKIHRDVAELVAYLFRHSDFPQGAVLSTGTGLVPALDFTLAVGDEVRVSIDSVGSLTNRIASASDFGWLTPDPARQPPGTSSNPDVAAPAAQP